MKTGFETFGKSMTDLSISQCWIFDILWRRTTRFQDFSIIHNYRSFLSHIELCIVTFLTYLHMLYSRVRSDTEWPRIQRLFQVMNHLVFASKANCVCKTQFALQRASFRALLLHQPRISSNAIVRSRYTGGIETIRFIVKFYIILRYRSLNWFLLWLRRKTSRRKNFLFINEILKKERKINNELMIWDKYRYEFSEIDHWTLWSFSNL